MIFAVFDVSVIAYVAVNKCRNWCFVHLYLPFYYKNKVLCWWSIINHLFSTVMKTQKLEHFGVTILTFRDHVTSSGTWPLDSVYLVSY